MRATDKPFNIDKKLVYEACHKVRASQFLQRLAKEQPALFVHWDIGMTGVFN